MMKQLLLYLGTFAVILTVMTFLVAKFQPPVAPPAAADSIAVATADSVEHVPGEEGLPGQVAVVPQTDDGETEPAAAAPPETLPGEAPAEVSPERQAERNERLEKMTKEMAQIYENMTPQEAALIISNLDEEVAVRVIAKMKKRQAAKVLAAMEPFKAVQLSKLMTSL